MFEVNTSILHQETMQIGMIFNALGEIIDLTPWVLKRQFTFLFFSLAAGITS